jgi:SAM-dependent methyltransferase
VDEAAEPEGGAWLWSLFQDPGAGPIPTALHPECDVMRFLRRSGAHDLPLFAYLLSGRESLFALEHVLAWSGRSLASCRRVLDFACGYGRLTRFLAHLGHARVWASDIEARAVDFVGKTFDVQAFPSHEEPAAVALPRDLDVAWVGSLFSHLPRHRFDDWLARLLATLAPDGLLLFSTHGPRACPQVAADASGFGFVPVSESKTLAGAEYGTAVATPAFVAAAAARAGAAQLRWMEQSLWGTQDLYVAGMRPLPERLPGTPWLRGRVERVRWLDPEHLWVGGSCRGFAGVDQGLRIEVQCESGLRADTLLSEPLVCAEREPHRDRELGCNWYVEGKAPGLRPGGGRLAVVAVTDAGRFPLDAVDLARRPGP